MVSILRYKLVKPETDKSVSKFCHLFKTTSQNVWLPDTPIYRVKQDHFFVLFAVVKRLLRLFSARRRFSISLFKFFWISLSLQEHSIVNRFFFCKKSSILIIKLINTCFTSKKCPVVKLYCIWFYPQSY
jgi:hypothetical protein